MSFFLSGMMPFAALPFAGQLVVIGIVAGRISQQDQRIGSGVKDSIVFVSRGHPQQGNRRSGIQLAQRGCSRPPGRLSLPYLPTPFLRIRSRGSPSRNPSAPDSSGPLGCIVLVKSRLQNFPGLVLDGLREHESAAQGKPYAARGQHDSCRPASSQGSRFVRHSDYRSNQTLADFCEACCDSRHCPL